MRYAIPNTVIFFTLSWASASAATIPVFGTGVNAGLNAGLYGAGQFLPVGAKDFNYTLTKNFLGTGSSTVVPAGADASEATREAVPQGWPLIPGVWATDSSAQWIAPQMDVMAILGVGHDTSYTYQTTFDLTGFILSSVELDGHWTADNFLPEVLLNGTEIYAPSTNCGSFPNYTFSSMSAFSISGPFQPGVNTLTFDVTNGDCVNIPPHSNPTGLLVDITGTGDLAVPEPGTMLPAAVGLALAACFYRLRRKIRA